MRPLSVVDIFKIGIGPSSSHTLGPWRAAQTFMAELADLAPRKIHVHLYGSLAKTGKGHGTDLGILLGLTGEDPVTFDPALIHPFTDRVKRTNRLTLPGGTIVPFMFDEDFTFHAHSLPFHPNGLRFTADLESGERIERIYYSIGGGAVVAENEGVEESSETASPLDFKTSKALREYCELQKVTIADVMTAREAQQRPSHETQSYLRRIWTEMTNCAFRGCHSRGILPGNLGVLRRAADMNERLLSESRFATADEWKAAIRQKKWSFTQTLNWLSCFALAVNEENATFGRVVTAPTNGAAGVVPAVLLYAHLFHEVDDQKIEEFLLTAGQIGIFFRNGATISAALGGCQAEIGVSSSMAAAGLCHVLGGSPSQVLMAAEIAIEHHLGLTCDPVKGLVQIPCIERNAMGAIKAITACNLALQGNPTAAKVSLDAAIQAMWATAQDMHAKYRETSEGGLAIVVPAGLTAC